MKTEAQANRLLELLALAIRKKCVCVARTDIACPHCAQAAATFLGAIAGIRIMMEDPQCAEMEEELSALALRD